MRLYKIKDQKFCTFFIFILFEFLREFAVFITLHTNALLSRLRYYDFYAMNSAILIRHIIAIYKLRFEFCIEKPLKNARMLKINTHKMCFNFNASKSFTIVTKDVAIGKAPMIHS